MRTLLALFLIVAILSQSLVNVGVSMYYHLNKAYITKQLCENRNNPAKHCNGHCYLSKQLKKVEEREKQQSQMLKDKQEEMISFQNEVLPQYFACLRETGFASAYLTKVLTPVFADSAIPPEYLD